MKHQMHGKRYTRLYRIWSNIKTRCYNANDSHYKTWGERGIRVCDEWKHDFQAFYDWAMSNGYQEDLTIERIDNDGNYSPDNCKWIPFGEQAKNRRNSVRISYAGVTRTAYEWAKILGWGHDTVRQRYHRGWSEEECLFGRR